MRKVTLEDEHEDNPNNIPEETAVRLGEYMNGKIEKSLESTEERTTHASSFTDASCLTRFLSGIESIHRKDQIARVKEAMEREIEAIVMEKEI